MICTNMLTKKQVTGDLNEQKLTSDAPRREDELSEGHKHPSWHRKENKRIVNSSVRS